MVGQLGIAVVLEPIPVTGTPKTETGSAWAAAQHAVATTAIKRNRAVCIHTFLREAVSN
jgi:hypothetical protein